ncbi:LysR family transcriptional regulator [Bosea sp. BK604]|uniref:LysR family transcriptional regulator n=1 Tax=Bosea sp. BK604 TaxID=2512180 RepID=UPI0010F2350C|nr:LysR family transcriptional regulator [Bosea sp. BK604]TCR66513.1 DNA-binding transcriptional LysR family regulator [Bosea sp. BK604]
MAPAQWDDIALFHAVVAHRALVLAAAALGLSDATLARRIKAFEARLGVPLFRRTANRLVLTEAGAALAADAAEIASGVERFVNRARAMRAADDAPVRITATTSISLFLTMHATGISAAAGNVEIVIISTRERLDIARGDADIAVRMHKPPQENGHFSQKVGRLAQALYARRDADPATAPIISVNREVSSRIDQHILRWANGRPIAARVGDSAARYESIRSSGAVSMAPCFMADADEALVRLGPPPPETADEIFLVSHEVSRQRPAVLAVLKALQSVFRENRARLNGDGVASSIIHRAGDQSAASG